MTQICPGRCSLIGERHNCLQGLYDTNGTLFNMPEVGVKYSRGHMGKMVRGIFVSNPLLRPCSERRRHLIHVTGESGQGWRYTNSLRVSCIVGKVSCLSFRTCFLRSLIPACQRARSVAWCSSLQLIFAAAVDAMMMMRS